MVEICSESSLAESGLQTPWYTDLIYDAEIQAVGSQQLIVIPLYIWQQD